MSAHKFLDYILAIAGQFWLDFGDNFGVLSPKVDHCYMIHNRLLKLKNTKIVLRKTFKYSMIDEILKQDVLLLNFDGCQFLNSTKL